MTNVEAEEAEIRAFGEQRYVQLAAYAWRGFLKHGRGAVLVTWETLRRSAATDGLPIEAHYLLAGRDDTIDEMARTYDPEQQFLLAVIAEKDLVTEGRVASLLGSRHVFCISPPSGGLPPPKADEHEQARIAATDQFFGALVDLSDAGKPS